MPSSGFGLVELLPHPPPDDKEAQAEFTRKVRFLEECAMVAIEHRMFYEWMSSFLAAWEKTKDIEQASTAGLIEWDL